MRFLALFFLLFSAAVASAAPSTPQNVVATGTTATTVSLDWDNSTGTSPISYRIFRNGTAVGTSNASAFTVTGLTAATLYTFTVSAVNLETPAESEQSPGLQVTTAAIPNGPGNLHTTRITADSVSLAWNAVTGATGYTVYRDDDPVGEDLTTTSFTDVGLTLNTSYSYYVTATTPAGESGESNTLTVKTTDGKGRDAVWAKTFRMMDIDGDGVMSFEEYMDGHTARTAKVVGVHRFEYSDTDLSGDLTLTEYAKALGGKKYFSPTRPRQFYLADRYFLLEGEEADGSLTEEEFALTLNSRTPDAKVTKVFGKRDRLNPNGRLSEVEFGIRGGSDEDTLPVE